MWCVAGGDVSFIVRRSFFSQRRCLLRATADYVTLDTVTHIGPIH